MAEKSKGYSAAYVSWATLQNALEQLSQALPHQIDRSVFPGLSWTVQNQLLTAMKFLGLTDDSGKPTHALAVITDEEEPARKVLLADIMAEKYGELFKLDLVKASPLQVQQAMGQHYGVSGDTLEKAMRFFVNAAEYCEIPVSPLLAGKKPDGTATRKRRGPGRPKKITPLDPTGDGNGGASVSGTSKTVQLVSGGSLTLAATLDLFSLNPSDRKFVFELIDKLEEYERHSANAETPEAAATSGES